MPSNIQVLVNANAGSVDETVAAATRQAAREHGADVIACSSGDKLQQCAQRAVRSGLTSVYAAGGDGTVNTVASALAGSPVALGVLPLGTLNHFAKDVGIPLDIAESMKLVENGRVIEVDMGEVNGRLFINNSGLGLYPDMVHHREAQQRRGWSKWVAAFLASLRALARYRLLRLRVKVNGVELTRRTPAVFVGNNEYRLDLGLEPKRTSLQDGQLCLYIPNAQHRLGLVLFSLRALFGKPRSSDSLDMILTDEFTIESRHRYLRVSIDGEVETMATPLRYRIRPRALRVLVPVEVP